MPYLTFSGLKWKALKFFMKESNPDSAYLGLSQQNLICFLRETDKYAGVRYGLLNSGF